jgi:hypothetical protein
VIELSAALLRQFRSVLRQSVLAADPRGPCPTVLCRAGKHGLTLSCRQGDVGLRHFSAGSCPAVSLAFPASLLAKLEAAGEKVRLEQVAPFQGKASWQSQDGPHVLEFDAVDPGAVLPPRESRGEGVSLEPGFVVAMDEAARTACRDVNRGSLSKVLLRGRDGAVIGSDGRQLLVQRGFTLPWKENLLLPALPVYGCRELPRNEPAHLSREKDRATLSVGPWTLDLKVEPGDRFPDVDRVIPSRAAACTRVRFDARDVEGLLRCLPKMPGHEDHYRPVTLDAGVRLAVRAQEEKGRVEEVVLAHSQVEGPPVCLVMDRRYLLRSLKLGFSEVMLGEATQPLLCKDDRRSFIWMPLTDAQPVPPAKRTSVPSTRVRKEAHATSPQSPRRSPTMSVNESNPNARNGAARQEDSLDLISEADEVRVQLQNALARISRLIAALKQQRRQTRVVEAALSSLRKLQQDHR